MIRTKLLVTDISCFVVIDSKAQVSHSQVMDDHWENEITEYGAVNITGFRIIDHSRKIVRDFMDGLRRMDPRFKGSISVSTYY